MDKIFFLTLLIFAISYSDLAQYHSSFRLMKEITEWFFESQPCSLQNQQEVNTGIQGTTNDEVKISQVITMAVPILFEKMCGIIYQIYKVSKERDLKAQLSFDGMKKAFVSILQLYETNCTSKNIQWQESPPIDVMIKMMKNVLWENIEKVRMSVEHYCTKNDEQLLVNDFGIWPKNESRLIFSLIWCVNGYTYLYEFIGNIFSPKSSETIS